MPARVIQSTSQPGAPARRPQHRRRQKRRHCGRALTIERRPVNRMAGQRFFRTHPISARTIPAIRHLGPPECGPTAAPRNHVTDSEIRRPKKMRPWAIDSEAPKPVAGSDVEVRDLSVYDRATGAP